MNNMMMKPFPFPFLVVVVAAAAALPLSLAASPSTKNTCKTVAGIEPTCKAAAQAHHSVDYDFCVFALKSAPNSRSEDLQGLAASAVRLAVANAESAEAKVDDLMDLELDPAARAKYADCLDAYDEAGDRLRDALDAVNVKLYAKAARLLRSAPKAYEKCNEVFSRVTGIKSPMVALDKEYQNLANIGLAIVSMVDN